VALSLLALETVAAILYGIWRYRTPLNPLTFGAVFETALTTVFPGAVAYLLLPLAPYSEADMVTTTALSGLYLAAFTLPFVFRGRRPARVFGACLRMLGLQADEYATPFQASKFGILLVCSVICFAGLAVFSGGGMLWIVNTRAAYQDYRSGAGYLWLLTAWFWMTAFIYYLWGRRPSGLRFIFVLILFTIGAYFTGSKQVILGVFITGLAYYHFLIRPVSTWAMILFGVTAVGGFFGLLAIQSAMTPATFLSYFEHFDVTTRFISRFNEYGYRYGTAYLSSFWFYVPRALVPSKPLEYGALLIPAHLFPGAYEKGYAPGFLGWSLSYLDFGWVGVFVSGSLWGITVRAIFEHYLTHRRSLFAFLFMMQICLWGVLTFASVPILIFWSLAVAVLLRLVIVRTRPRLSADLRGATGTAVTQDTL
jgi:hypothetical protein